MARLSSVLARAGRLVPECPEHRLFDIAQEVHIEIAGAVPEAFRSNGVSLAVSANAVTTSLPAGWLQVDYVANGSVRLYETSIYALNEREADWRTKTGTPTHFYIDSGPSIGLYPRQTAALTLTLHGVVAPPLTRGSIVAQSLPSDAVYVYGIAHRACLETRPQMADAFGSLYVQQLDLCRRHARSLSEGYSGPTFNQRNEPSAPGS